LLHNCPHIPRCLYSIKDVSYEGDTLCDGREESASDQEVSVVDFEGLDNALVHGLGERCGVCGVEVQLYCLQASHMGVSTTVIQDHGNLSFQDVEPVVQLEQPVSEEVTIHPGSTLGLVPSG